mgnify:CR=1 FL=1
MKTLRHNKDRRKIVTRSLPALLMLAMLGQPVLALTLDQARSQNLVKETASGYLVVVKPTAEAKALAKKVNAGRKAEYQKIANKRGTSLSAVEQLAGKRLTK